MNRRYQIPARLALISLSLLLTCCSAVRGAFPGIAVTHAASSAPVYFHRKLEPEGRTVLHGAGQTDDKTFRDYSLLLVQSRPMLTMHYLDLKDDLPAFFADLTRRLNLYPDYLVPQLGLSLNSGAAALHYEADVAAGNLDPQLTALCTGLKSLDRPVFLRVGYEFNTPWNGYQPATYIAAFRHIAAALHTCQANAVALVWDYAPDDTNADPMRFYPGDDAVDWWAINLFTSRDLTSTTTHFLDTAAAHHFPVMIGESTPREHPVTDGSWSVSAWFRPFFALIHAYPQIKAFCYINWDWRQYHQWASWGDTRIQDDPTVLTFYQHELTDPLYQNATDRPTTLRILHAQSLLPPPPANKPTHSSVVRRKRIPLPIQLMQ